jgi:hypothetical protein
MKTGRLPGSGQIQRNLVDEAHISPGDFELNNRAMPLRSMLCCLAHRMGAVSESVDGVVGISRKERLELPISTIR